MKDRTGSQAAAFAVHETQVYDAGPGACGEACALEVQPHRDLGAELESVRSVIEARFLTAGQNLAASLDGIASFTSFLETLSAALSEDLVRRTAEGLETGAGILLAMPSRHGVRHRHMQNLRSLNNALRRSVDEMRRILLFLHGVAAYNKITAAGSVDSDQELCAFAQETESTVERGRGELNNLGRDLAAFGDALAAAIASSQVVELRINDEVPAIAQGLKQRAAAILDHHEKLMEAVTGATRLAGDVQMRAGRLLVALQVGDITRQRIEHVIAAASRMVGAGLDRQECDFVHGLIGRQIRATEIDFRREIAEIVRSMTALAKDARELLVLRDAAYGRSSGNDSGFLRDFASQIGHACALVNEIEASDREADATGRNAANLVQELKAGVATIQRIKAEVQSLALNAILKCKRIGEAGRPLVVIAEELHEQGAQLGQNAGDAVVGVEKLLKASEPLCSTGETGDANAASALSAAASRIQQTGTRSETDLSELIGRGDTVVQSLDRSLGTLEFENELGRLLDEVACEFEGLGADAEAISSGCLEQFLADFAASYTMASERQVHAECLAQLQPAPEAGAA